MKAQRVSLWLVAAMFFLGSMRTRGLRRCLISMDIHHIEEAFQEIKKTIQAKDTFQNVTILSTSETLHSIKPLDVCCMTKNLLAFYVDKVFKDHRELNPQILRKISSIANSFLYMQKALQQCQEQMQCHCRDEATNATRIIHDNYDQLEVRAAAIKSLGELDIFLAWIDKNNQGTSAA
ncbi:interleukin-19 [Callorhinus ursinus]|uniref:Interleukin family protein n=2 Tax=Otariidae TaxID=9702 RepID=A0A3Q7P5L5_CALUR|nr:interleukin-19 [Callorhinus ursinus]XP_025710907.1 interleukin-19 [Callorhinus ursinus]XP_025710908.1 interleukin-19 [Callorhinus ursinus]XP_025710909.1 interleukin-19 [Callorhinus ursinus]XP_025710910.1 interleukin-19 [Callorhinus ursinus]XP_025710911.1 interleukin-19 [Callorhinus ursinus]XP_025710912.1 interleukin-19 [Callorhinus ursinus]XP_025710913.1 interleukin-19 [Callorhinus ursinus]XP_025710914.1 interleukin-19 [Callorhinus ursinus]XP_027469395.1 interleukin-19 [Zalophus califor